MKKFLLKHVGNMGDMIFLIPPIVEQIKRENPKSHITLVTAWGYKDKRGHWGQRNQGGFSLHLLQTNPYIDQLIHWHDTKTSLDGKICLEEGYAYPTWSAEYYEVQKKSARYDAIYELDIGLKINDNPLTRLRQTYRLPIQATTQYRLFLSESDQQIACRVMEKVPKPRIVLLESLSSLSTRSWDPKKVRQLEQAIKDKYHVEPYWFGARHAPYFEGRPLSLRENIATLIQCDVGIGVLSGPLHFAAAVGLPTLTLYCDQPLHRAAPAYFLNSSIKESKKKHRTLIGPSPSPMQFLKYHRRVPNLTPPETPAQHFKTWQKPGKQSTKSCLAVITVKEVMTVLADMIPDIE